MNEKKLNAFKGLVFAEFGQEDHYDKTLFQLLRAREIYLASIDSFSNMSTALQYQICATAFLISMGTSLQNMRKIKILSDRSKEPDDTITNYSLEYGYEAPEPIEINTRIPMYLTPPKS